MKFKWVFLLICFLCTSVKGYSTDDGNKEIYESYVEEVIHQPGFIYNQELLVKTAYFFLETPYKASTLEKEPERLVVNLREVDCMTFVETVLALSLSAKKCSFEKFCESLQRCRYREGVIHDYVDRLHYTSDWIYENERKNIIKDITKELGGERLNWNINFITTHINSYNQLITNTDRINFIRNIEKQINQRTYYYIPKKKLFQCEKNIRDGDIIAFVTSIKGLDISHVGIACHVSGILTFIHASSVKKKVVVNESSLQRYIDGIKSNLGLIVVRPLFL